MRTHIHMHIAVCVVLRSLELGDRLIQLGHHLHGPGRVLVAQLRDDLLVCVLIVCVYDVLILC